MIHWLLRYRLPLLIVLVLMTLPFAVSIPNIKKDAGLSALIPESHPDYQFMNEMNDLFGASDQIVIGINASEGIFTLDSIQIIDEITTFYLNQEEIEEDDIVSLTTVNDITGTDGELVIEPMVDVDEMQARDMAMLNRIRQKVTSNPMYHGKLVSFDEKSAVVLVGVPQDITMNEDALAQLKSASISMLSELNQRFPAVDFDFSGPAMMKAYISEYMLKDLRTLFPIAIGVVAVVIFVIVRSVMGMLVPIMVTLFAVIWTFGLKSLIDSPITIVETAIPVALIAIGCADGIHIISDFLGHRRSGSGGKESVTKTMRVLTLPVILTSLTTSVGFLSLITAPGVSIKNMGIFLAFGVGVAMIFSITFIPMMLSFFKSTPFPRKQVPEPEEHEKHKFESLMEQFGGWLVRRKGWVASVGIALLALSFVGIFNIEIESDELRYLKKNNPFRNATEKVSKNLGGITSLDIIIEGDSPDFFKKPEVLRAMQRLQIYAEADDLVSYSLSLVDLVKRLNFILHDGQSEYDRIPNDVEWVKSVDGSGEEHLSGYDQIAQYLFLYEISGGDSTSQFVDSNYQVAKISLRLKDMSSRKLNDVVKNLTRYGSDLFPEGTTIRYTNHYIRVVMMRLIIESQIFSLLTVLVTIFVVMSIIFKSPLIGAFTSLPVITAVLLNFTVMWAFNVTLNIGTSIIASVGMGIGIDYAIHYYTRFRLFIRDGYPYADAIVKAISVSSRAILTNAAAVGLGFLVLLFSEYGVIANIGWIITLTMLTTALGSLMILPSLLAIFKPKIR